MGLSCSASSLAPGRLGGLFLSYIVATIFFLTAREGTGVKLRILFHLIETGSRKEVFQPHLPVRLPCYDLAPVTGFTLGRSSRLRTSGTPGSHGLTGGVYKARERIHRAMADARLLANPASWSRVADSNPYWDRFLGFAPRRRVAALCTGHCNTCVAPDVRAVLI